jgi:hypothetical protein
MPPKGDPKAKGDADDEEKQGLELFLYTLYEEAFAYRSIKMMKIWDWRLTYMSRSFTVAVLIYVLFFIILGHGYLQKEEPFVGMDLSLDMAPLNLSWQSNVSGSTTGAPHCNLTVPGPNGTASVLQQFPYCVVGATDYVWDANGTRAYVNNTCVPYFTKAEVSERGTNNVWLYTYWRQSNWARSCVASTDVPKYYAPLPAGYPANYPNSLKDFDFNDPGFVPNCGAAQSARNLSVLLVQPERAQLTIRATYSTSWGRTRSLMATTIQPRAGVAVPLAGAVPLTFTALQDVTATFQQLLALAGIDLDAPNTLDDGGRGPINGTAFPT